MIKPPQVISMPRRKKNRIGRHPWPRRTIGIRWPDFSEDTLRVWVTRSDIPQSQRKRYQAALQKIQRTCYRALQREGRA